MSTLLAIAQNDLACYTKNKAPIFWTVLGPALCMWLFGFLTPSSSSLAPVTVINHSSTSDVAKTLVQTLQRDGHTVTEASTAIPKGLAVEVIGPSSIVIHAPAQPTSDERGLRYEIQSALIGAPLTLPARPAASGGFQRTVPAYLIMFLTMNLLMSGATFAEERASGRLRRLLTAPISTLDIIVGRLASRLVIAWVQMLVLLSIGVFLLHISWTQHAAELVFVLSLYTLAMGGVGILLGTLFKSPDAAQGFAMWLALLMAPLTGLWWPVELMPTPLIALSKCLPTGWIMRCLNSMLAENSGLSQFPFTVLGLTCIAAVVIWLASRRLAWR